MAFLPFNRVKTTNRKAATTISIGGIDEMGKFKQILCLDFDGVIHSYKSGWKGAHIIPDAPVEGAAEFIIEAANHYEISIFSSRSKSIRGRWAMQAYIRDMLGSCPPSNEGKYDFLYEEIKYPWFKPSASITIDDRAITFTGKWPEISELKKFKPWNKL
jgi:hypothetical protein